MKKIIFIALAATTAIAAAPASAQSGNYGGNGYGNVEVRADQLQVRLQAGVRSGAITRAEAVPLREQLRQLTRLETLYARDGISGRERADLQQRINNLRRGIRLAERSGDNRYGGGGGDGFDRDDDRYSRGDRDVDSRYDRDSDGWDDRDGNRDGRWDVDSRYDGNRDGYDDRDHNRDGRWDNDEGYQQTNNGGIVGQIIDRVTGNDGLRVGQRASAGLGGVPYAYRTQFRDGNGVHYRSDSRQIYQIDARTGTVLRIYPMNR
ncbi:MAG TPA: hypothetical protein VD846_12705 [Allosphingosinicella sp.]|nr:hypothetical protein [Allosphingosinicella sp.]